MHHQRQWGISKIKKQRSSLSVTASWSLTPKWNNVYGCELSRNLVTSQGKHVSCESKLIVYIKKIKQSIGQSDINLKLLTSSPLEWHKV